MSGPQPEISGAKDSRTKLSLALVFLAAVTVYAPTLCADFTNWDDPALVLDNPRVRGFSPETIDSWLTGSHALDVPFAEASYALDFTFWGLRPLGFHLSNVLLHALCAMLLWQLSRSLRLDLRTATTGALLFALHPAGAEVVAWVSQRRTLLAAVFLLAACLTYLRAEGRRAWPSGAACVFFFACSLLSKSVATAPLPILLPFLHKATGGRLNRPRAAVLTTSLILALGTGVVKLRSHAAEDTFQGLFGGSLASHAALVATTIGRYALKLIFPVRLSPYYDFAAGDLTLGGIALGLVLAVAAPIFSAWLLLRRPRAGVFALGAILFWLPTSNMLVPFAIPMADRYLYLPLLFLAPLAVTAVSARMPKGDPRPARLLVAVIALFGFLAAKQGTYWRSSLRLWSHAVRVEPGNPWVWQKRAYTLWKAGRPEEAVRDARVAVRILPRWLEGWETLAQAALAAGETGTAEEAFRQELGLAPNAVNAWLGIARVRARKGDARAALAAYARALEMKRDHRQAAEELAALGRSRGLAREALAALPDRPTSVWIELARGDLLSSLGRGEEADRAWREILRTRPGFEPVRDRLRRHAAPPLHNRVDAGEGPR